MSRSSPELFDSSSATSHGCSRSNDMVMKEEQEAAGPSVAKENSCTSSITRYWVSLMAKLRDSVSYVVLLMTHSAATHPWWHIIGITLLSLGILGIGLLTNFKYNIATSEELTPKNSVLREEKQWILDESGFPPQALSLSALLHKEGKNVLSRVGVEHVFQVVDAVRNVETYKTLCNEADASNQHGYGGLCHIRGVSLFWNQSRNIFEEDVSSDVDVILAVNADKYPDGSSVKPKEIMGHVTYHYQTIIEAESFLMEFTVPDTVPDAKKVSEDVLDAIMKLRRQWATNSSTAYHLEAYLTDFSLESETLRAVYADLPLIPTVFVIMTIFTCLIFSTSHKPGETQIQQRLVLGIGAVITILFSLATSYGLLYIIGVPFTSLTQILPFVMFGIGLDDAFIIFGEYVRTDNSKDPVQRIHDTFEEVGLSIFLTSLTTALAFMLGCMGSVPNLIWLSLYAFPTVIIDFVYQITFFVAMIVLDERRIARKKERRSIQAIRARAPAESSEDDDSSQQQQQAVLPHREIELSLKAGPDEEPQTSEDGTSEDPNIIDVPPRIFSNQFENSPEEQMQHYHRHLPGPPASVMDRFMTSYANFLLKKPVKILVIVFFLGLTIGCVYSASHFTQKFNLYDVLSKGSYVSDFFTAIDKYADRGFLVPRAYFRYVNQSDPEIQQQMENYVDALAEMKSMTGQPPYFWLRHFKQFLEYDDRLQEFSFEAQVELFLDVPVFKMLYGDRIVRDPDTKEVLASSVVMYLDKVDMGSVKDQVDVWQSQLNVTKSQPINSIDNLEEKGVFNFFLYEGTMFYAWDFYSVLVNGLIFSTVLGIATICIVSFLFLPHWTAAFILTPMISVLYIDLIGFLHFFGVSLNGISYFSLVMSIGLLVDFNMHILLRYYESPCATRENKVRDALQTMGSSVVIGGLSTFLGVFPLLFSTSDLLKSLFYGFWGMVLVGCGHGVVLLPVLLAYMGPINATEVTIHNSCTSSTEDALNDTASNHAPEGNVETSQKPSLNAYGSSGLTTILSSDNSSDDRGQNSDIIGASVGDADERSFVGDELTDNEAAGN